MATSRVIVLGRLARDWRPADKCKRPALAARCASDRGRAGRGLQRTALFAAFLVSSLTAGFSGCCHSGGGGGIIDRIWETQVSCMRDRVWAKRAFHLRYGHCTRPHADHFREGFVSGYGDVCIGGAGECPAIPPEKYWGFEYRSREGAEMQNAWFAGFESGSSAARSDGSTTYSGIQISRQIEQAMIDSRRIEDEHAGIQREYIVDMAPVRSGSSITNSPVQSSPSINSPRAMTESAPFVQSAPVIGPPMANTPMTLPHTSTPRIPASSTGTGSNRPMPVPIVPAEVPIIPGSSQR